MDSRFCTCSLERHNVFVIAAEDAKTLINDKITLVEVVGNKQSGVVYNVEWFDQAFFRKLECASKTFNKDNLNKTIEIAKHIDSL